MKKFKTVLKHLLIWALIAAIFSCNNTSQTKEEATVTSSDTTASETMQEPPPPPEFKPFTVAMITHTIKDYSKWRPVFDADSDNRKDNGLETIVVGREIDNPNNIMIAFTVADLKKATNFSSSPKLKETMQKAGVISKPKIEFCEVLRINPDSHEKQWVDVSHKVKNYEAWLKVFDAEGPTKRASDDGLVDVVLARDVDDSNLVHLVFDIKDMAKAKAALSSPEKKKLMMSAGVEGTPKIQFYQLAE